MEYNTALEIATKVKALLQPHCERIEIAGSIRRKKPEVKDIEIVAIPKPYDTGLFESGIAAVVNQWEKVKGELPCKYTQRILPEGIKLDLFLAEPGNWGLIFAIRTGSADYSHQVIASAWSKMGFYSKGGYLYKPGSDHRREFKEEKELFHFLQIPFLEPEHRNI